MNERFLEQMAGDDLSPTETEQRVRCLLAIESTAQKLRSEGMPPAHIVAALKVVSIGILDRQHMQ